MPKSLATHYGEKEYIIIYHYRGHKYLWNHKSLKQTKPAGAHGQPSARRSGELNAGGFPYKQQI